jgi:bifunctional UDP-N-acetylglucosamine pyrophosphorylase / glucosamine-1-phosphate N-acetyltransferase
MRSDRPKPLHLLCGRPMVLYVLDALERLQSTAPSWWSATAPSGSPRSCRSGADLGQRRVRRAGVQRGTGDAVAVGLTGLPTTTSTTTAPRRARPARRHAAAAPETIAELVATTRATGAAATSSPPGSPTRPATAGRAGPQGRPGARIVEQATTPPDELAIDEINTGIYCFRRDLLAPALRRSAPTTPRASTTSPTWSRCWPTPGTRVDAWWPTTRTRPRASTTAGSWPRRGRAAPRTNRRWLLNGVTMLDPAPPPSSTPP